MQSNHNPLQVIVKVKAPNGLNDVLIRTITPLLGSIRARAGCIDCHVYQDTEHPEEMALLQEWETENAFAEHVGSRDYRYILEWMEMSDCTPAVTVSRELNRSGFDIIKKLIKVNR